jgi:hypothetical protein
MSWVVFDTVTKGISIAADLCDVYTHVTSDNLTSTGKIAAVTKTILAGLSACALGAKSLDYSLDTQTKLSCAESLAAIINVPVEVADCMEQSGSNGHPLDGIQIASKVTGIVAQVLRVQFERGAFVEKGYLAMSDEERAKATRPIYQSDGEDIRIVGYKPVNKAECEENLAVATSGARVAGFVESIGKTKIGTVVPKLTVVVSKATVEVIDKFTEFYRRIRGSYQQQAIEEPQQQAGRFNFVSRNTIPPQFYTDSVLKEYTCLITKVPIRHPVIDPTTKTLYERAAIEQWINENHTSPLTRRPLKKEELIPANDVAERINTRLKTLEDEVNELDQKLNELLTESNREERI